MSDVTRRLSRCADYNERLELLENPMLSILLSTVAFFVSTYYVKRYLENMGIPKGMTRGVLVFSIALVISYLVAFAADHLPQ